MEKGSFGVRQTPFSKGSGEFPKKRLPTVRACLPEHPLNQDSLMRWPEVGRCGPRREVAVGDTSGSYGRAGRRKAKRSRAVDPPPVPSPKFTHWRGNRMLQCRTGKVGGEAIRTV